jgi:hypothetical protein
MMPFSRCHVRAVTHLHISHDEAERAAKIICELHDQLADKTTVA